MHTMELVPDLEEEVVKLRKENTRLKRRVADRANQEKAKWLLVGYFGWTEREAHKRLMKAASSRNLKLSEVIDRLAAIAGAIEELAGDPVEEA